MELLAYAVVGLALTWGLYAAYMMFAARAAEGRPATPLYALFPDLERRRDRALVYCYSPRCGPCRPMSKEVAALRASGLPVYDMDVTAHPDVAQAMRVRAAPTLIVVERGEVAQMLLGVRMAAEMQALLAPDGHRR
jgi:thioredoxin 1